MRNVIVSSPMDSRGNIMKRLADIDAELTRLKNNRRLESASIGKGGLRLKGGTITVDSDGDIVVTGGRIIAGDPDGIRAQIDGTGYQLYNDDGEVDIDLTTTSATNQIRLRGTGGGAQDNEILLTSTGEINGRILAVDDVILDGNSLNDILDVLANAATPTSEKADPEPPPASGTITRVYRAQWSQAYQGNGSQNNFTPNGGLTQGFYSSSNGNQRSLIGFNSSAIQSDHSGRTITRVRVWLRYGHWFNNSGGTAVLGHHGHSSAPSSFSGSTDNVRSSSWPKPGSRWVTYSHSMSQWLSGTKTGIVLGPGPSTSRLYYGWAFAHNHSNVNGKDYRPRLEIRSVA